MSNANHTASSAATNSVYPHFPNNQTAGAVHARTSLSGPTATSRHASWQRFLRLTLKLEEIARGYV